MNIVTRPATAIDLPILLTFEQRIIAAERPYDETLLPDPISYYDIGELITSPESEVIVAELDGVLIGSGSARRKASRHYAEPAFHAYIGFLYVVPEHRGKGVNHRVLNALFAWARANDLPDVHLTVYPGNEPAMRAYEKVGFEPHILEMRMNLDKSLSLEGPHPG